MNTFTKKQQDVIETLARSFYAKMIDDVFDPFGQFPEEMHAKATDSYAKAILAGLEDETVWP